MYYSKFSKNFAATVVAAALLGAPADDLVEISDEQFAQIQAGLAAGGRLVEDAEGNPVVEFDRVYFDAASKGFYSTFVHAVIPTDAIEIDEAHRQELLQRQSDGARIEVDDESGLPIAVFPTLTAEELAGFELARLAAERERQLAQGFDVAIDDDIYLISTEACARPRLYFLISRAIAMQSAGTSEASVIPWPALITRDGRVVRLTVAGAMTIADELSKFEDTIFAASAAAKA